MSNEIRKHAAAARNYSRLQNEGGEGYNPHWAKHDAAVAAAVEANLAAYADRWTEVKAAWNAAVAKYAGPKGVSMADLAKIEAEAGINHDTLKLVKARVEG